MPTRLPWQGARLADQSIFAERYRIEGVLGRGGMGEVYRAHDETLRRTIALKVVRVDATETTTARREDAKRRLLNEARFVSVLAHPHIVEIHDAGESNGLPYLVLELCDGGNLRTAMVRATQEERLRWLVQTAEALAHAHDQGIVHRDIKPENVLLTRGRIVKVADFGIAKALRSDGMHGHSTQGVVGTPRYMAPEQLFGRPVDARADQFAWGLVAYELMTGVHPRAGAGDVDAMHSGDTVTANSNMSLDLRRVLLRATANEPDARYPNFGTLLVDLRGEAIFHTPEAPEVSRGDKTSGRRFFPLAAVASAALTVFGGTLAVSHVHARSNTARTQAAAAPGEHDAFDAEKIDAEMVNRCAPAARPDFVAGLRLWRDASQWEAITRLEGATKSDPECAPASVYYLLAANQDYPKRREQFQRARDQRAKLNERERQLLDALEPSVWEPPDYEEVCRRAEIPVEHVPRDLDFRRLYVRGLQRAGRLEDALAAVDATAALQPDPIPGNEYEGAMIQALSKHDSAAFERFERCLATSPDSADCLQWKGLLHASKGQCVEAESVLRHLTSVMPQSEYAHFTLANVLLNSTHDAAAARDEFEERWRRITPEMFLFSPSPEAARINDEFRMAVAGGNLDEALLIAQRRSNAVARTNDGRLRGDALATLIEVLQELGYAERARTLALQGLKEHRAWTFDDWVPFDIE
ncbi:MAG TPA: serine/threonine-protein kinase, partial [Polyangiaceae bacterium]|nr:serine/threonine-protein kinase [Polyangiaceae bacterium]